MKLINKKKDPPFVTTVDYWNNSYQLGNWDYLNSATENTRYSILTHWIQKYSCSRSVLDLGCGDGILCTHLGALNEYLGVDVSPVITPPPHCAPAPDPGSVVWALGPKS